MSSSVFDSFKVNIFLGKIVKVTDWTKTNLEVKVSIYSEKILLVGVNFSFKIVIRVDMISENR